MCAAMDVSINYDDLEKRRRRASTARKNSKVPSEKTNSEAMAVINEIFNPKLKLPVSKGPYRLPEEVTANDFDALKDLDINKLAELKEVFTLFDTDSDGLISKDDLRFTFMALGNEVEENMLEEMLKEAKDPLDYDGFVELMSHRTIELDPEDVLLEAWSKWDDYGTGKIEEQNCFDFVEIFPYLREPVIENATSPEFVICNSSAAVGANVAASGGDGHASNLTVELASAKSLVGLTPTAKVKWEADEFIYSGGKMLGIRVRFKKLENKAAIDNWILNITGEYRFLKKDNFKNDGRLIPGSYCDYYFFADTNATPTTNMSDAWQYFHSPRFPAKYPSHIKCAYKFLGRPESRVQIIFDELEVPRQGESCNMDRLTIFDSESANMNAVIDVICNVLPARRIVSSGPDLLIEFNASSNMTAKGFRGKFRFLQNELPLTSTTTNPISSTSNMPFALETFVKEELPLLPNMIDLEQFVKHPGK